MNWLILALVVIIVPGLASILLVRRHGSMPGVVILAGMILWALGSYLSAEGARNVPIAPEIFGGQTIAHAQVGGFGQFLWTIFVLGPATLWAAIALLIGRASFNRAKRKAEPS